MTIVLWFVNEHLKTLQFIVRKKVYFESTKTLNTYEELQNGCDCLSSNLDNIKIEVDTSR